MSEADVKQGRGAQPALFLQAFLSGLVSAWALASIHAGLGEKEEALHWLDRAFEERDSSLVWLKVHPRFDALRGEPRFEALLERMRF